MDLDPIGDNLKPVKKRTDVSSKFRKMGKRKGKDSDFTEDVLNTPNTPDRSADRTLERSFDDQKGFITPNTKKGNFLGDDN